MSRGGARDNAGRKSGWVNTETKLIRIPVAIESELMAIAKKLDQGEIIDLETKSIEIESVTESNLDSVTDSIKEIVDRYRKESDVATPKNTRWDQARKLLNELELILYPIKAIETVTETKVEQKELVTESNTLQIELIPSVLQLDQLQPLSQPDLATRLKVSTRTIRDHKKDLVKWSKSKDPDGIGWEYRVETKKYHPLN